MHRDLAPIVEELTAADGRVRQLEARLTPATWLERPGPDRWSPAECVAHLNLTTERFRPLVAQALDQGRRLGDGRPDRYRKGLVGWLLWKMMAPPVRQRMPTTPPFIPGTLESGERVAARFHDLQAEFQRWLAEADGLPLNRLQITSPFNARLRYNLFACFAVLARHQHRHLWQAEQAAALRSAQARP